jgi:hypothetical protein
VAVNKRGFQEKTLNLRRECGNPAGLAPEPHSDKRTYQALLDFGPASPKVKTFHRADSDSCSSHWIADAKDLSNYSDTVLRIRNLRKCLLWFSFNGRCFFWFTLALAFDIKRVNQSILIRRFCASPTLKLRLSGASHRRFFQEWLTTCHNYRINCTIRSDGED